MRRALASVICLASLAMPGEGRAGWSEWTDVTFVAPAPCSVACPYWVIDQDPCTKEPTTVPGSWDDHRVTVPEGARALHFEIYPRIASDSFACRVHHPGTPEEYYETIAYGGTVFEPWGCEDPFNLVGCDQSMTIPVQVGQVYVLRVYNWTDAPLCDGRFRWYS